jgi:hypothetical protein
LRHQRIELGDCGLFRFNRLPRAIDNRRVQSPARLRCGGRASCGSSSVGRTRFLSGRP